MIKFFAWLVLFLPFAVEGYWIFTDQIGPQPAETLNEHMGQWTLWFFLSTLYIGVFFDFVKRFQWKIPLKLRFLLAFRRQIGVATFIFASFHITLFFIRETGFAEGFKEIQHAQYLWAGSLAYVILFALALTSNNFSVRKLGRRWKKLHRLTYLAFFAVFIHTMMIEKANIPLFLVEMTPLALLLIWRFYLNFASSKANE